MRGGALSEVIIDLWISGSHRFSFFLLSSFLSFSFFFAPLCYLPELHTLHLFFFPLLFSSFLFLFSFPLPLQGINMEQVRSTMQTFSQESMKMEMSQEMMEDTLSDVFDNSEVRLCFCCRFVVSSFRCCCCCGGHSFF